MPPNSKCLSGYDPETLILVAGARPLMRPLRQQTWETFSVNWHTDVRVAFHWLREALLEQLQPGSRVIVISSGAALAGSPLSVGYAGAKATQRFITAYAQEEANRADLGITFCAVLPQITPLNDLGWTGGTGLCGAERQIRGGVRAAVRRGTHPRRRWHRPAGTRPGRCRNRGARLPADQRSLSWIFNRPLSTRKKSSVSVCACQTKVSFHLDDHDFVVVERRDAPRVVDLLEAR
jgi:NAD(P)-dependent dehydrogenase (short-subunit alcohol dehydrogenase family)